MPSPTACEREITELHDLFVRWYCGRAERAEFERLERALGAEFELVSPDGTINDRETVLASIREAYDSRETFDIEIRNVEPVVVDEQRALVRYEEWQSTPTGETGRLSTGVFESLDEEGTPTGSEPTRPAARWRYLQETWLDGPDD